MRSPCGSCQSVCRSSQSPSGQRSRSTAAHQGWPCDRSRSLPTQESTPAKLGRVASQIKPFALKTVGGKASGSFSNLPKRTGWKGTRLRYAKEWMPNSSVSGACSPVRASLSHFSLASAAFIEKRPVLRMSLRGTCERTDCTIWASGLNRCRAARTSAAWLSDIRSHLFSTRTLANSIWSTSSCAMGRTSSSYAAWPRDFVVSIVCSSARTFAPSTTVTRVSNRATSFNITPLCLWSKVKVSATGSGSEMPEDSTTT
mmetsp:Transcript_71368/g.212889  ORF Transcript_71368/g.212889 Transcript_71368/m.212889 type:complete len:257 (-) Transcript_71368:773-1543(-)